MDILRGWQSFIRGWGAIREEPPASHNRSTRPTWYWHTNNSLEILRVLERFRSGFLYYKEPEAEALKAFVTRKLERIHSVPFSRDGIDWERIEEEEALRADFLAAKASELNLNLPLPPEQTLAGAFDSDLGTTIEDGEDDGGFYSQLTLFSQYPGFIASLSQAFSSASSREDERPTPNQWTVRGPSIHAPLKQVARYMVYKHQLISLADDFQVIQTAWERANNFELSKAAIKHRNEVRSNYRERIRAIRQQLGERGYQRTVELDLLPGTSLVPGGVVESVAS